MHGQHSPGSERDLAFDREAKWVRGVFLSLCLEPWPQARVSSLANGQSLAKCLLMSDVMPDDESAHPNDRP
jgi:hypothetical protein